MLSSASRRVPLAAMDGPSLFLSYNSADRPGVVAVQKLLAARGITTFLDRDQLVPGLPWPAALEAFREEHAAFFAGRATFASELFKFTVGKKLVVVVGPSGSGKSSVAQAGLGPLLRRLPVEPAITLVTHEWQKPERSPTGLPPLHKWLEQPGSN